MTDHGLIERIVIAGFIQMLISLTSSRRPEKMADGVKMESNVGVAGE